MQANLLLILHMKLLRAAYLPNREVGVAPASLLLEQHFFGPQILYLYIFLLSHKKTPDTIMMF